MPPAIPSPLTKTRPASESAPVLPQLRLRPTPKKEEKRERTSFLEDINSGKFRLRKVSVLVILNFFKLFVCCIMF